MKKLFLILPLLLVLISISSFAGTTPADEEKARTAFTKQFPGASNVKWTTTEEGYLKATFLWVEHQTVAYYDENANFLGSARGLFYTQLPLMVVKSINDRFEDGVIIHVMEISNQDGVFYLIALEQKDYKYKVRINSSGDFIQVNREKL